MKKLLVSLLLLGTLALQAGGTFRLKEVKFIFQGSTTFDVMFTIEGGQADYTYTLGTSSSITTPNTTATLSASAFGAFFFTILDDAGAMINGGYSIRPPEQIDFLVGDVTFTYAHPCDGVNNGKITISAQGASFLSSTFFLDNNENPSGLFPLLAPQSYIATARVTVDFPGSNPIVFDIDVNTSLIELAPVEIRATPSATTCGDDNGSILINTISGGGCGPYTVTRNPGGQTIPFPAQDTFTGLAAGAYTLTASPEGNNCEGTTMETVGNSEGVAIDDITLTPPRCSDTSDGSIKVTASSQATPITFMVTGQPEQVDDSMATFSGLPGGMYTVLVTDANGCTASQPVDLIAPDPLQFTCHTGGACGDEQDGFLTIDTVSGGTPPYTGCLTGATIPETCKPVPGTFDMLGVGTYTITITDDQDCEESKDFPIDPLTGVMIVDPIVTQNITCNGFNDGSIKVFTSPQTEVKYELFENGTFITMQTSASGMALFEDLPAGEYTVKVTNTETQCMAEGMTTLTQPNPLMFTVTKTDTTCAEDNGEIEISGVGGGTPPYEYSIGGGVFQGSPVFKPLEAGMYTVTVRDANGCTDEKKETIQPSGTVEITMVNTMPPTCFNFADGSITVFAESPVSQELTYILTGQEDREQTSATGSTTFNDLSAGFYMIQVIDEESGCEARTRDELPAVSPIRFRPPTVTPVTCKGACNGSILLATSQVTGGTEPYTYSIGTSVGCLPVGEPFCNLTAGTYTVMVKDANGCESHSLPVFVEPAVKINIVKVCTKPAHYPDNDGMIRVVAESRMPLQYALNDGPFQQSPVFEKLAPGTYRVIVNREGDNKSECTTRCTKVGRAKRRKER